MSEENSFIFEFTHQDCNDITGNYNNSIVKVNEHVVEMNKLPEEFSAGVKETVGAIGEEMAKNQATPGLAPTATPYPTKPRTIDITNEYNWTKTGKQSINRRNTPTVTLQESLVSSPAFFNNLVLIANALIKRHSHGMGFDAAGVGKVAQEGIHAIADWTMGKDDAGNPDTSAWLGVPDKIKGGVDNVLKGVNFLQIVAEHLREVGYGVKPPKTNGPPHLLDYEPMYGVRKTHFTYLLPYMTDTVKEITNSWSTDNSIIGGYTDMMKQITSLVSPGVGIDLSKTFDFPDTGPTHQIKFYLDNTIPENGKSTEWKKNFRFVFLLLYQNLPNKLSRVAIRPPVIYRANLPGVFSYRWSFLSNISVNFIGNRRPGRLKVDPHSQPIEAIIPEGYEITLALTSLTPETKNLMYDSVGSAVTSSVQHSADVGGAADGGVEHPDWVGRAQGP